MTPKVRSENLRSTRLGAVQRRLLRDAARWPVVVAEGARSEYDATVRRRAAKAMAALGLVDLQKGTGFNACGARCAGMWIANATDLGRAVIAAFEREIAEPGRRIRWSRFEARAQT